MKRFTNLSVNSHFFSLNKRLVGQLNWKLRPPFYGKKCHSLLFESPQLLQWKYSVKNISYLYKARKFIEFYILEFVYAASKIFNTRRGCHVFSRHNIAAIRRQSPWKRSLRKKELWTLKI